MDSYAYKFDLDYIIENQTEEQRLLRIRQEQDNWQRTQDMLAEEDIF